MTKEKERKVPLTEDVHAELQKKAEAEGTTPDKLAEKIITEKTKGERKVKHKEVVEEKATFPAKGMINAYGFLHLSNGVAEAFGSARGKKTPVTIDFKEGNLIISKA